MHNKLEIPVAITMESIKMTRRQGITKIMGSRIKQGEIANMAKCER